MKNNFACAVIIISVIIASGCVRNNTPNVTVDESTENITNNTIQEKSIFYEPVNYSSQKNISITSIDYPVILENPVIRIPVKFYINYSTVNYGYSVFYQGMINDTIAGFRKWENATNGAVRLVETENLSDAVVVVNFIKNYDIANVTSTEYGISWVQQQGEGGVKRYSAYRGFNIVEKSIVYVFPQKDNRCETIELAEHELGHAMGLGHDKDLRSIMFERSSEYCKQIFTPQLLSALNDLYKDAKPDLRFKSVIAKQAGQTGSINITFEVKNIGLADSDKVGLWLSDGSFVTEAARIRPLGPDETVKIDVADFRPTVDKGVIYAYIDLDNSEEEINREDNTMVLTRTER